MRARPAILAAAAVAAAVLAGGCQSASSRRPAVNVSAAESPLMFSHPDDVRMAGRFYRQTAADYSIETNTAVWTPDPRIPYPILRVIYHALGPNRYFTQFSSDLVEQYVSKLDFGKAGKPVQGSTMTARNALGLVHVQRFSLSGHGCFAFEELWGPSASVSALGTRRLIGFYCDRTPDEVSDASITAIVNSIGVRGEAVPARVAAKAARGGGEESYRLRLDWQDRYANAQITLAIKPGPDGKNGRGAFDLPNGHGGCSGAWILESGSPDDPPMKGRWSALCTNGLSASGSYESPKPGAVSGEGVDADGKRVTFSGQGGGQRSERDGTGS